MGGNRTDGSEIESVEFIQLYGITKQKPHLQATNLKLSPQQVKQEFSIQQAKEKVPQLQTRKMIPQLQTTKVIPQQEENSDNDSTEDEGGYKIYSVDDFLSIELLQLENNFFVAPRRHLRHRL